ncbi:MAG: hypothetical protein DRR08_27065 [Candidatus Parabeggiatoa sp. nov. 2]|nr:MAG: hypothetical protein DRR08_27065 [Gammaproteobacteria bacterium]
MGIILNEVTLKRYHFLMAHPPLKRGIKASPLRDVEKNNLPINDKRIFVSFLKDVRNIILKVQLLLGINGFFKFNF